MKQEKRLNSSRKLKDYPQIPGTPPPSEKRDKALVYLEEELEHERKYLYTLCMENKELEEILQNLEKEITNIKKNFPENLVGDGKIYANSDYWFKYESQQEVNRKLQREKRVLQSEIKQIEEQGLINLDSLSQSELILYVKHLERTKTDLLSDLRSKEWGLDKQAKDIHHLNDMKKALQAEIRRYDKQTAMSRFFKKTPANQEDPQHFSTVISTEKCEKNGKIVKLGKSREKSKSVEEPEIEFRKQVSLSKEDISEVGKADFMFSSLDESQLRRMENESLTLRNRKRPKRGDSSEKKITTDSKKERTKHSSVIGCLPELMKSKNKTLSPRFSKTKKIKDESKVGTESPKSKSESKPIKIIVTYETQTTKIEEKKTSFEKDEMPKEGDRLASFRSIEEVYEDDFEESDGDKYEGKPLLTTTV